jgi:hypothetical protein
MAIATINPATGKTLKTFEPLNNGELLLNWIWHSQLLRSIVGLLFQSDHTGCNKEQIFESKKRQILPN